MAIMVIANGKRKGKVRDIIKLMKYRTIYSIEKTKINGVKV